MSKFPLIIFIEETINLKRKERYDKAVFFMFYWLKTFEASLVQTVANSNAQSLAFRSEEKKIEKAQKEKK